MTTRAGWVIVLLGLFAAGGGCAAKDPVAQMLQELEEAAEERDAVALGARLSAEFRGGEDGSLTQTDAVATARRYLAVYEALALNVHAVEIARQGGTATIRCVVEMSARPRRLPGLEGLLPPDAAYWFSLEAQDEGGTWRVRRASWKPTEPSPLP